MCLCVFFFFFSSRRRHTRFDCDWSSDVCSSDLYAAYARQDYKAAIDHARTAVEQDPDNPQLQKLLTTTLAADRKSTRLNSSHSQISYAVFCLKKKHNDSGRMLAGVQPVPAGGHV